MVKIVHLNEGNFKKIVGEHFDVNRGIYEIMIPISYSNPLTILMSGNEPINEGLIKTYPFNTMKRYVCQYFNILDYLFHEYENNGIRCVAIDISKDDEFIQKMVDKAMNLCGYFKSQCTILDEYIRVHYEPKFQEKERYDGDFFYHITHHINFPKIKRIGLVPSHKNRRFNYGDRVYLFSNEVQKEELIGFAEQLRYSQNKAFNDGLYFILKIKDNGSFNIHKDPNFENGFWTSDNIPPSCIIDDFDTIYVK